MFMKIIKGSIVKILTDEGIIIFEDTSIRIQKTNQLIIEMNQDKTF